MVAFFDPLHRIENEAVIKAFTRYDLDQGGTINTAEELNQLCTYLQSKIFDTNASTFAAMDAQCARINVEAAPLNLDGFVAWFFAPSSVIVGGIANGNRRATIGSPPQQMFCEGGFCVTCLIECSAETGQCDCCTATQATASPPCMPAVNIEPLPSLLCIFQVTGKPNGRTPVVELNVLSIGVCDEQPDRDQAVAPPPTPALGTQVGSSVPDATGTSSKGEEEEFEKVMFRTKASGSGGIPVACDRSRSKGSCRPFDLIPYDTPLNLPLPVIPCPSPWPLPPPSLPPPSRSKDSLGRYLATPPRGAQEGSTAHTRWRVARGVESPSAKLLITLAIFVSTL